MNQNLPTIRQEVKFMRSLEEREKALNMYFQEGKSYQCVAKDLNVPLDTVKS